MPFQYLATSLGIQSHPPSTPLSPTPHPSLPILIAMVTTMQETQDAFRSLIQKMTTIAAYLLHITDKQWDLIY
jgi:hypothetical protein